MQEQVFFFMLPSLARPVAGGCFVLSGSTFMSGTERLASFGVVLFDGHLGVTESDNFDSVARFHING